MKQTLIRKAACMLAAAAVSIEAGFANPSMLSGVRPQQSVSAVTNFAGANVASRGKIKDPAVIRGTSASVVYDSDRQSDVLVLNGSAFGDGWLQLPKLFSAGCADGFTFSMRFKLNADTEKYMRMFQFSSIPLGTGAAPSYSSPDISVDLNDKTAYRASVFAGTSSATENDGRHRSIFTMSAAPDSGKWHQITVVYTPSGANFYLDGNLLTLDGADDLSAVMQTLYSDGLLQKYQYCSVGHSLYTDNDLKARVDDVAFYDYPLTAAQVRTMPDDPAYIYTFDENTITEGEEPAEPEVSTASDGTQLTAVPGLETVSPDGTLVSKIWRDSRGSYYYSVSMKGNKAGNVILPSKLGFTTTTEDLSSGFPQTDPDGTITEHDETYKMPNGKHVVIRDHYNEVVFPLVKGDSILTVYLRTYDDGVGVRYALNHGASIRREATQVIFPDNSTFWGNWPNATYEWDMVELPRDRSNESSSTYSGPFTGLGAKRYWGTVPEANVFNEENPYCAGALEFEGNYRKLHWKGGVKVEGITMQGAFHTPWRAVVIGDTLDEMSSSDLILNLNPPSKLTDTSWIKPGKVAWSWWSSGGDSPVEYHTQKDYIDFAADNGWDYVCLDFGWALWDDSAAKVKELCDYAKERGIGIYLWYGVNNKGHSGYKDSQGHPAYPYYSLLDEQTIVREFERISGLGVQGVKVDYYESDTQETMKQMYLCMDIAAKNHLMVLFHGCTVPRGESRTYPNVVSYEAINGSEYYKWFDAPALANRVSYTFTRNVIGSADFTPTGVPIYGIKATAGFALADVVTIESGVQHFAHSVYTYEGSPALPLLNDVPVAWDDIHVIDGRPMKFNVTARRKGSDWYIGASTLDARTVSIPLSELISDDGTYNAYIFADNTDGSALEVTVLNGLTKNDSIERSMLANGGFVIKLTKGTMNLETPYSNYRFYEAEKAKLDGRASVTYGKDGKYSSGNAYVGYVGGGGNSVTFENVEAPADGEYTLRIYYISGEPRSLMVDVNGGFVTKIDNCYANKNDWSGIRAVNTTVTLKKGKNTVKLYNSSGNAPSIDRIALAIPNPDYQPPAEAVLAGDVNFDGRVDARDLSLLKQGLSKGFPDSRTERAADFNTDGKADAKDAAAMVRFLTCREG